MTSDCKACDCKAEQEKIKADCGKDNCPDWSGGKLDSEAKVAEFKKKVSEMSAEKQKCYNKRKCLLSKFGDDDCCPGLTGHHVVPGSAFCTQAVRAAGSTCYDNEAHNNSPAVCAMGTSHHLGTHGKMHDETRTQFKALGKETMNFPELLNACTEAHAEVFQSAGCDKECTRTLLKKSYEDLESREAKKDNPRPCGITSRTDFSAKKWGCAPAVSNQVKMANMSNHQAFLNSLPI